MKRARSSEQGGRFTVRMKEEDESLREWTKEICTVGIKRRWGQNYKAGWSGAGFNKITVGSAGSPRATAVEVVLWSVPEWRIC